MAVAPLQLPGYAAPTELDWTSLDKLGQTLKTNRVEGARREAMSLATLGADGSRDYTKTVGALTDLGDYDGAAKVASIQKSLSPENSADLQAYGVYRKEMTAKGAQPVPILDFLKEKAQAGATRVTTNNNVNTGGGGSDKQIYDTLGESAKGAQAAATGLQSLREARKALEGGIISGAGADQVLGFQKLAAALGLADSDKIVNTETFRSAIAPQVAAMIKATVGNANISNSDREFGEKAAGGNITLDAKSIARLVDIMERAGTGIVNAHNKRLDDVYPDDPKFKRERALFRVQGIEPQAPAAAVAPKAGELRDGYRYRGGDPGDPASWAKQK